MINEFKKLFRDNNGIRYPRLDTVLMVEEFIIQNSGKYKVYQLWERLPKKIMYQTYKIIVAYLLSINKIAVDSEGKIGYIWSPELGQKYKKRKDLKWE